MKKFFVLLACMFLNCLPIFAWGSAGHMVIAAEAFRQLSPELKAQAIEILKSHPDYKKWTNAYHPNPGLDVAAYVFIRSSTWPDEVRGTGGPYDHGNWHFIDYPLRPPNFAFEPDARPNDNLLFGIAQSEKALSDTNDSAESRAAYLSYLIHLIGDLHQPLHCESLYTGDYTNGDRGGNDFFIKPGQKGIRLHGLWDGLLGSSANPRLQWNYATKLDAEFPRSSLPELAGPTTPKDWSLESRELAIEKGYLHGELKGGTNADTAPMLPEGYTKAAKAVAERQGALAGYRLADEIQKYLKYGADVPLLPENTNVASTVAGPKKIGALDASKYYDDLMTVTGKVVQISERSSVTILSFDKLAPNTPFTAVIFDSNLNQFKNLQSLTNQNVEVTGSISEYRGKPEIILESPDQITVIGR